MTLSDIKKQNLPDSPGVYFFKDAVGTILYIGKATSVRDRVRSYFTKDLIATRGELIVQMVSEAASVAWQTCDSVLEALLLEAHLIKKHTPPANTIGKDDKSFNHVVITREDFPRVLLVRGHDLARIQAGEDTHGLGKRDIRYLFGPFLHGSALKEALRIVRKIFPYRDKCTPISTSREEPHPAKPCFNAQIGLCPGVCAGAISKRDYNRIIQHLRLFFEGKKSTLMKNLEQDMHTLARAENFE